MDTEEQQIAGQLAAYALGALDIDEMAFIERALADAPERRDELNQLREVVALLPYAAAPANPPDRVRERLLDRIAASTAAQQPVLAPPPPAPVRRRTWFMPALMSVLAALVLGLGGLTFWLQQSVAALDQTNRDLVTTLDQLQQALADTQMRQNELATQLASSQDQLAALGGAIAQERYVVSFVTAPGVATRTLEATLPNINARGEMYMYPGNDQAVVIFSGLHTLEPGQTYQFWLADGQTQVAAGTFVVDQSGIAQLLVDAPREVNAFSEVMVTVEPAGGSIVPSDRVILTGSL
jgi:anti-sigma-K factor RskA